MTVFIFICLMLIVVLSITAVLALAKKMSSANANRPDKGWEICVMGAIICLVISISSTAYTCFFLSNSRATIATVVDIVEKKNEEGETAHYPVYKYFVDNVQYEDRATASLGRHFSVGDEIPVRFQQARPHESRIDYWGYHWGIPVFMLCAAIVCAAFAVVLRWRVREGPRIGDTAKPIG